MRKMLLGFILLALVSCSGGRNRPVPAPGGQILGNGGDRLRALMEEGRWHAAGVLERVDTRSVPRERLAVGEWAWFEGLRDRLIAGVRAAEHRWAARLPAFCPQDTCACTVPGESLTYFSYEHCHLANKQEAGKLLLVEEHHRQSSGASGVEEQRAADRLATALYAGWKRMGHVDSPHWVRMEPDWVSSNRELATWTGSKLLLVTYPGVVLYDPKTGEWSELIQDPRYPIDVPGGIDGRHAEFFDGRVVNLPTCDAEYDAHRIWALAPERGRWEAVPGGEPFSPRRQAHYHVTDAGLVVWGGEDCNGQPKADGFVLEKGGAWTSLPPSPLVARKGYLSTVVGETLVTWGGDERHSEGAVFDFASWQWRSMGPSFPLYWNPHQFLLPFRNYALLFDPGMWKGSAASYFPAEGKWGAARHELGLSFRWAFGARVHGASQGSHALFLNGDEAFIYDPSEDDWIGPFFSPDWGKRDTEPLMAWTGMDWIVWHDRHGFRFYP